MHSHLETQPPLHIVTPPSSLISHASPLPSESTDPTVTCQKFCSAHTNHGPCQASPRHDTDWCIFHDPAYAAERRANSAFGGRRSRRLKDLPPIQMDLTTRAGIQDATARLVHMQLRAEIPVARATAIIRAIEIAERNLTQASRRR